MGIDADLPMAFAKSQMAASAPLPRHGTIFISVSGTDKERIVPTAKSFSEMGFSLLATTGTAAVLQASFDSRGSDPEEFRKVGPICSTR